MENNAAEIVLAERRNENRRSAPEIHDYRLVSWVRLVLRILSMLTCALISMSLIDAFSGLPDKEGLKMYPTLILLGVTIVAGVFNIVLVLAAFTKAVRQMTKVGNITTMIASAICLVLWVAVTAYYGIWDTSETNWDLLSWTCTHRDYGYKDVNFEDTCIEMRFAFWAGVSLAGLEVINFMIFVIWWLKTRRTRGYFKV